MADDWLAATNQALSQARDMVLFSAGLENQKVVETYRPNSMVRSIDDVDNAPDIAFRLIGHLSQLAETAASASSVIRYRYVYMDVVAQFALQILREHSPVGGSDDPHAGLYRDSHMLFIDGHNVPDANGWQAGQTLFVSNPVPYARKIELGTMKVSVPPHVYETCAPIVADQFADSVNVKFTYMPVRFGSNRVGKREFRRLSKRSGIRSERARADWLAQQPALVITAK